MNNQLQIFIDNQPALIDNFEGIGFRINFEESYSELELNVDSLILVNESKYQIDNWITNNGVRKGIPVTIKYGTLNLDYYVDLTKDPLFKEETVEVKIFKRKGKDSFTQQAQAHTFDLFRAKGIVYDTIDIPYLIVQDNQLSTGLTLSLALFSMSQALAQAIRDTAYLVAEASAAVGGLSPAMAISAIAKAVIQATYTVTLFFAVYKLSEDLFQLLFPKIRYFKGVKAKELIEKSCVALGYTFNSTLLNSLDGLTFLPVPLIKNKKSWFSFLQNELNQSFTKGYPTAQDTIPTLQRAIDEIELMFNAKTRVINGRVEIEVKNYWQNLTSLQTTPALNFQQDREEGYTLNTSEGWIRYYIHYLTDYSDLHILDNFAPNDAEYGTKNISTTDADLDLILGLEDKAIGLSLGHRKSEYNWIEKLAIELLQAVDALAGTNTANLIENRIGVLQISQQFYANTKVLYLDSNNRQPENYLDYISAPKLWANYHSLNQPQINGFEIHENAPLIMGFDEFSQLLNQNYIEIDGANCEISSLDYIPYARLGTLKYRKPNNYDNGKIVTFVINE